MISASVTVARTIIIFLVLCIIPSTVISTPILVQGKDNHGNTFEGYLDNNGTLFVMNDANETENVYVKTLIINRNGPLHLLLLCASAITCLVFLTWIVTKNRKKLDNLEYIIRDSYSAQEKKPKVQKK